VWRRCRRNGKQRDDRQEISDLLARKQPEKKIDTRDSSKGRDGGVVPSTNAEPKQRQAGQERSPKHAVIKIRVLRLRGKRKPKRCEQIIHGRAIDAAVLGIHRLE